MGDPRGFLKIEREAPNYRSPSDRVGDYDELTQTTSDEKRRRQASRCMDCGTPFCMSGCPLGNMIPDFNDLVYKGKWKEALRTLSATNNFPEFTGKICPYPCENSCVLGIVDPPVAIKQSEQAIIEKGFEEGWIRAEAPSRRTGKSVAIVGSGPAGLACAQQLNRAGHDVTVYEKAPKPGGLLMYGIPAYKLQKKDVMRRVGILEEEGVQFKTNSTIGKEISWQALREHFDALVIAIGSEQPRDLNVPGRDLKGVHFAIDFLTQQTCRVNEEPLWKGEGDILATAANVVVIGGGDTGADCIGTSLRQRSKSVTNFELLPKSPVDRSKENPWPQYARIDRESTSAQENRHQGGKTEYSIATKRFIGDGAGKLKAIETVRVEWEARDHGRPQMQEVPDSTEIWDCELALLAMGFTGPVMKDASEKLGIDLTLRGHVGTSDATKMTNVDGVFAAGDCRRGQSLVVWAIAEGREVASCVDTWLMKENSKLPRVRLSPYKY